jgi:hypothetical protein
MSRILAILALTLALSGCVYGGYGYNYGNGPAPAHSGMPNGDIPGSVGG